MERKEYNIHLGKNVPISLDLFIKTFTSVYSQEYIKESLSNNGVNMTFFETPNYSLLTYVGSNHSRVYVCSDNCAEAVSELERKLGFKFEEIKKKDD